MAFAFDADVAPEVDVPAGWSCAAPVRDTATTTVTCTRAALASQHGATFHGVHHHPRNCESVVRMAVAARSQTRDPANVDNDAAAQGTVVTAADLSVRIEGGVLPRSPHRLADRAHAP